MNRALHAATAAMVVMDLNDSPHELPDAALHGLALEAEADLAAEPGSRIVTAAEVKSSPGVTREGWDRAIEKEFQENFAMRNVFTVSTDDERRNYGIPLPMKLVFAQKGDGRQNKGTRGGLRKPGAV